MRYFLLPGLLGIIFDFLLPVQTAYGAQTWCLISNIPCNENLYALIQEKFIDNFLRYGVIAVVFGMFAYYALAILFSSDDENATTQMKTSFGHAIVGCAIVSIAILISDVISTEPINPLSDPGNVVKDQLQNIIDYFKIIVGALVSFHVTYQGIRLIALQGKEEELSKQKTRFFHGLIGIAVVLLATKLVEAASPGNNAGILSTEIKGIADFLITLFGLLAVVAFIASAAMLLLSVDESWKEKGKKGMFGSVIVLIIVFASFAIIKYVFGFA
ncbi:hypothetical protein A3H22_00950 [Candidatus Peribacteria bacterium RIFCSPLOWO2_12_FULL_55_15]|nr:MAG: hypothetical protein A2789_00710 [Candidatus Peribacteria bacterium RIFCSPHIGHO2_01_FULL_54_22]OGJ63579.1 MAG: hypothetical protein A3D12_03990 [Candidatus Peribacteria bacterium RIFCSPHIGHO2_02_FULL_55_24]OGJ65153.1 MAG: hypothetical protein A3E47_03365 [Candidatus Peribacteria bacterium RIFCSPHIGHO2_12_FULL_54_10]OGJ68866.1 MAG: hypothetical protein A2947_03745 [Candidatus Peribacteria bacterium RIFCSPLOWO2_01_FULL_54_110]OGJ69567.1 MAG: hypothetical protein A3H90_02890 [Candidatus Pe